jgi:transposase
VAADGQGGLEALDGVDALRRRRGLLPPHRQQAKGGGARAAAGLPRRGRGRRLEHLRGGARIQGGFALSNCGAHARRRFIEAEAYFPECKTILELYGELYQVEKEAPPGREGDAQRAKLRQEKSKPITQKMLAWALETRGRALPESALGQAIRYLLNHWEGLIAFLNDPRVPLDNNATERAERGIVLGRKNHYGSRSKRGTEVAALMYALIESCKLVGVDPAKYLRAAVDAALGGETMPLPHEYAAQIRKAA